jgi:hypothetical protein
MAKDDRTVETKGTYNLPQGRPVPVGDGFALPAIFRVDATIHDPDLGAIEVGIDVEVSDRRTRARQLSVRTERPGGVSSTVLRAVPIRDLIANEARRLLMEVEFTDKGTAKIVPVRETPDTVKAIVETVREVVGYVGVEA